MVFGLDGFYWKNVSSEKKNTRLHVIDACLCLRGMICVEVLLYRISYKSNKKIIVTIHNNSPEHHRQTDERL